MTFTNYVSREIVVKIVLTGADSSPKGEVARLIYDTVPHMQKSKLRSPETAPSFDFRPPISVGGFKVQCHFYTLLDSSGFWNSQRLILQGMDAVIWVLDSSTPLAETLEGSLRKLGALARSLRSASVAVAALAYETNETSLDMTTVRNVLNVDSVPVFRASQTDPQGVLDCLKATLKLVLQDLSKSA